MTPSATLSVGPEDRPLKVNIGMALQIKTWSLPMSYSDIIHPQEQGLVSLGVESGF